jgi:ribose/xylose/arabinose/galactoside ABC-type transport system permease subunit
LEDDPVLAVMKVVAVVGVIGLFLGVVVALTGTPRFLVPRGLRPGGEQADLI